MLTDVETLILSDLHLGSRISEAEAALETLKRYRFRRLILLGDIFDDLNLGRLKKKHWELLFYLRQLANPKRNVEVVWIEGNHDVGLSEGTAWLIGIPVYSEYAWESGGRRYLAIHGHQFDRFSVSQETFAHRFTVTFFRWIQRLDKEPCRFSRFLGRMSMVWSRQSSTVARGATEYARQRGAEVVFCGHTHDALHERICDVEYFNTGCWTDRQPSYVTVGGEGVRIHWVESLACAGQPDTLVEAFSSWQ